jgi:hypothetical protein
MRTGRELRSIVSASKAVGAGSTPRVNVLGELRRHSTTMTREPTSETLNMSRSSMPLPPPRASAAF